MTVIIRPCGRCQHPMSYANASVRPSGVRRACGRICLACASKDRNVAGQRRASGPSRDVDEVVVLRLKTGGYTGRATAAELRRAVVELQREGLSIHNTARRLGCSSRTVQRHRVAARAAASRQDVAS